MPRRFPVMPAPQHPGRRPAGPFVVGNHMRALGDPPRDGQDQRDRHVGGVVGQHAGRIGDGDAALNRARHVDIVDAIAEIRDQPELLAGLRDDPGIDPIGHGRHEHVGGLHGLDQGCGAHRRVVDVEAGIEQFAHARLDHGRQLPGHHDQRLLLRHRSSSRIRPGASSERAPIRVPKMHPDFEPASTRH